MFDRTDLRAAVDAGIITRDQASRLDAFLASRIAPPSEALAAPNTDENLRFLNNFNDIFNVLIGFR